MKLLKLRPQLLDQLEVRPMLLPQQVIFALIWYIIDSLLSFYKWLHNSSLKLLPIFYVTDLTKEKKTTLSTAEFCLEWGHVLSYDGGMCQYCKLMDIELYLIV